MSQNSKSTNSKSLSLPSKQPSSTLSSSSTFEKSPSSQIKPEDRYLEELTKDLSQKKINFRQQPDDLWIYPKTLKEIKGSNLLIPGTKCPAIKNFMGIKVKDNMIYMVESSNRISFPAVLKEPLVRFCNFINMTNPVAHLYVNSVILRDETRLLINSNRIIHLSLKEKLTYDFIEEIITIDKIYQTILSEHLPVFMFREFYFKPIFIKETKSNLEKTKEVIIKSVKGMGFTQDKKQEVTSYYGKYLVVSLAVNIDIGHEDLKFDKDFDWRILPITLEIYDHMILIKIRFCKNKHVVKIENEHTQNLFSEFINYANLNLKKARYRFSYTQLNLTFESTIVTSCLDFTQIQFCFQETFSYMIENFKKFGSCFAQIYNATNSSNPSDFTSANVKEMYRELKQGFHFEETNNFSLFYILSTHKNQVELLIPERFEVRNYTSREFSQEVSILAEMNEKFPECYHVKVDEQLKTISYPVFEEGQTLLVSHTPGGKQVFYYEEFLKRLMERGLTVNNPLEHISLIKQRGGYFAYFSDFPLFSYVSKVDHLPVLELKMDLRLLTEHIVNLNQIAVKEEISLTYIEKDSFDQEPDPSTSPEAMLIGNMVTFTKITDTNQIESIQREQRRNLPSTISILGLYQDNENHYIVSEKLKPVEIDSLTPRDIWKIFLVVIQTILLLRTDQNHIFLITEKDLFYNQNKTLKIQISSYDSSHLWNCFSPFKTSQQKQVYSLSLLVYRLCCKVDPFAKFTRLTNEKLISELQDESRIPIFDWEFEQKNPRLVDFLRKCWFGDFESLEKMKDAYPIESI
jgi:hypothetical protein